MNGGGRRAAYTKLHPKPSGVAGELRPVNGGGTMGNARWGFHLTSVDQFADILKQTLKLPPNLHVFGSGLEFYGHP